MDIDLERAFGEEGDFAAHEWLEWLVDYAWDIVGPELTANEDAWGLYQRSSTVELAPRLRRALDVLLAADEIEDPEILKDEDRELLDDGEEEAR